MDVLMREVLLAQVPSRPAELSADEWVRQSRGWARSRAAFRVIAAVVALPIMAHGPTSSVEPIRTTLCEVARTPLQFNGKTIALRSPVEIGSESFGLSASACTGRQVDFVWLEYGRGPKKQPTIWCCGDLTPRDSLPLVQDKEFDRFHHYLTAVKKTKGCDGCYLYRVTATLTGRLDAVATEPCPGDAKARCCSAGGFGHLGFACARLVIGAVSDVAASPVDPSAQDKEK